jgi:hypothetical protein
MKDTYTIRTDLTWQEYYRLLLYTMARTKVIRVLFGFLTCIALLDGVLNIAVPGKNGVNFRDVLVPVLSLPLAPFLFFSGFGLLSALYVSKYKAHLITGINYTFTHWGMERTGHATDVSIPWRDFTRMKETKHFFLLYCFENKVATFEIIQKEKFGNAAERDEFRQFIQRNLSME